ncbi:MAG: hypothetical protein KJ574_05060 [Nanoarchaeota archaeon]|nr:hypothetical protein [Nanoarchaeota archaeon]
MATPTEQILNLRAQGLSNNQIAEMLQRQGFTMPDILNGMRQADVRADVQPFPLKKGDIMAENPMIPPTAPPGMPPGGMMPPPQGMGMYSPEGGEYEEGGARERIEELAEAIIDEKWADLVENINRIIEWKEKTESRISSIETEFKAMKDSFDKLHMAVLEKVGEYDHHIQDVGTEVKALEKVFQKVLPGFIENVGELSRITERMKRIGPEQGK